MQYVGSSHHSFDWKGFSFFLKCISVLALVGLLGQYRFALVSTLLPPPTTKVSKETIVPSNPPREQVASPNMFSRRVINSLTPMEVVPTQGKFIAADLVNMRLLLYEDGTKTADFPILSKGKPGTPWETPSGFYAIQTKEEVHFSTIGEVYMPYAMQFYGNYFIHGWTYYPDGTPVSTSYSGGCIKLHTEDAEKVFAFAYIGTKVFVYDSTEEVRPPPLQLDLSLKPHVRADAYVVADIDTGDVYTEKNAEEKRPISALAKFMTALVANEVISFEKKLYVRAGDLSMPPDTENTTEEVFLVGDLFYPLLMQSSDGVADALATYYGTKRFVKWMNTTAKALDMASTTYADPSGISPDTVSTPVDLFRLAAYLAKKKSFVLAIAETKEKTIIADDGSAYKIKNSNLLRRENLLDESKSEYMPPSQNTTLSVLSFNVGGITRRVGVAILDSRDERGDLDRIDQWLISAVGNTPGEENAACASCITPVYRKIEI